MYCYSIEKHEEDISEISTIMNKVTALLNLRIRISDSEEIDENELDDIVVCVDLVCNGTDLRREDIVIRDGATASFEKEDNILVRFLTALVSKVKKLIAKLKRWRDSLFDRKNVLGKMIESTRNLVESYAEGDDPVIITRGIDTFVVKDKVITDYRELSKYVGRISSIIKAYKNNIFPKIEEITASIEHTMMLPQGDQIMYQVLLFALKMEENNATKPSIEIDKKMKDIYMTIGSTTDSFKDTIGKDDVSVVTSGPMIGNLSLSCHYRRPLFLTDTAYFESLNKFKLKLVNPEQDIEHKFSEVKFDRWDKQTCSQAIDNVADVHKDLAILSDIMKDSVREVERFSERAERLLKDSERADSGSRETMERTQAQRKLISAIQVFNTIHSTVPEHLYEHAISQMLNVLNLTRRHIRNEGAQKAN